MCGIVGYVGFRKAQDVLLQGLERLEYRGYDSAGIAVLEEDSLRVVKANGRLVNLRGKLLSESLHGTVGIGHTRWATHGKPSDINAHPHTDASGRLAIVHNGIIENHADLRSMLEAKGCVFVSETDSEVIAHLLHCFYEDNLRTTLNRIIPMLQGSYALCVIAQHEPQTVYCVRKDSPLVVGYSENENFVASDVTALLPHTRTVDYLHDGEIALLRADGVDIYSPDGQLRKPVPVQIEWNIDSAEKNGYDHFMLKEIHEEPDALQQTFSAYTVQSPLRLRDSLFPFSAAEARALTTLHIVACGTAYHAAVIARYAIEQLAGIPVSAELASEFRYRKKNLQPTDAVLAISQSGETADTLGALREGKRLGCPALALTNVLGSSITQGTTQPVLYTYAGPEIAVASTKAYITQAEVLLLLAVDLAMKRNALTSNQAEDFLHSLEQIPSLAYQTLSLHPSITIFARRHNTHKHLFFIGRGIDYALAMEASLKLKEVSYIPCEAYAAGELKHGPIALIEPGTLVCAIATQPELADKTLSNILETRARGAQTLVICTQELAPRFRAAADTLWILPDTKPLLTPLLAAIPLQLLAYAMAVSRGCDVDKPRNLAKSVTVE